MKVSVFGLGYVGCVTAACLARAGHRVFGVDLNHDKVALIAAGRSPIVEPGLPELLAEVVASGRLSATTDAGAAITESDVALICVGTPSLMSGEPDTTAIQRVGREIGRGLSGRTTPFTVILRSTCLPGTTEGVLATALQDGAAPRGATFALAMNPEFMREGSSLADFKHPPIIVVGYSDPVAAEVVRTLYADVQGPFVRTSIRTAEMLKYVSNAYHGLKVRFANEIGDLCESLDVHAQDVMRIFAMDRKLNISEAYLRPGFAFGGSCLPKDLRAIAWAARNHHVDLPVLSTILPSNHAHIRAAADAILSHRKRRVGIVGLAFKPGTDDLRESPIVALTELLIGKGCDVRILDRHVAMAALIGANRQYIDTEIPHIASLMCASVATLVEHADLLVIGSATPDAAEAIAGARPDCTIVDLTRGAVGAVAVNESVANSTSA